jgi:hypothetical protein
MATKKITELVAIGTPASADLLAIVDDTDTTTKKVTLAQIRGIYVPIALGSEVSGTLPVANGGTGITSLGAGVATWLGTPSGANLASALTSALPDSKGGTGLTALGAGVATFLGTPSGANLASALTSALPDTKGGTGLTALGSGVATFLGTPSSANLRSALTDETGTGAAVFANAPDLINPRVQDFDASHWYTIGGSNLAANRTIYLPFLGADDILVAEATTQTLTNKTIAGASNTLSVRIANDVTGLGANVATFLATPSSANLASAVTDETGSGALVFGTSPTLATPRIADSAGGQNYIFAVSNLTADRTVTLPLLTGNDSFVFEAHTQTLTNKTYRTVVTAMGALAIDWALGNAFTKTLASGGNTITFSNDTDGQTINVALTSHASGSTVTWPAAVRWTGGTEPTQSTPSKTDIYTLIKLGGVVYGSYVQDLS